jgi:hypothetical protein
MKYSSTSDSEIESNLIAYSLRINFSERREDIQSPIIIARKPSYVGLSRIDNREQLGVVSPTLSVEAKVRRVSESLTFGHEFLMSRQLKNGLGWAPIALHKQPIDFQ